MPDVPYRVDKPWGYELIWSKTDHYAGKILFVRGGESLSLQFHKEKDEAWYVLEGRLGFRLDGESVEAGPGEVVFAARGSAHSFWNAGGAAPARYILVMTPRIHRLVQALHTPGAGDYAEIFRAHASELL